MDFRDGGERTPRARGVRGLFESIGDVVLGTEVV